MMTLLRRHRQWLMIVIAILAIPFVFYFVQKPDYGAMRSDRFARVYDRNISMVEAQQNARLFDLARALGMSDFLQSLTAGANDQKPGLCSIHFELADFASRGDPARHSSKPF